MLIIYAHPNHKGNNGYVLKRVEASLKRRKYEVLDLYKTKFDPVLRADELYSMQNRVVTESNKKLQALIKKHKELIFIYPTWWDNMPAILKGFLDRVFTPGFAFKYTNKFPVGLLDKHKALVITTTGAPDLISKVLYKNPKLLLKQLKFCAIKPMSFIVGNAQKLDDKQKNKIKKVVSKALTKFLA
ncbi:flavodoxin family protein [Candidatus Woesearchaeota archaeon]|nr:flavodoxin family protein [Candidatus Woesearchaeota archaeon]